MSKRINGNMFPYETVANIDVSDLWDSGRYGTKENGTSLSSAFSSDTEEKKLFEVIGTIDTLSQAEAFWFIMMLSLIKERYYDQTPPTLALSYVGLQINHPALEKAENALLVQSALPSLSMDRLSFEDIENMTFGTYYEEHYKSDWNKYLVDRYKNRVSEEILNILDEDGVLRLTDSSGSAKKTHLAPFNLSTECGTEEELSYRQRWIARYNYASTINKYLQSDYDKNCCQIYEDIKQRIDHRLEDIAIMCLRKELVDKDAKSYHTFDRVYDGNDKAISVITSFNKWWNEHSSVKYVFGTDSRWGNKADYRCALTGEAPGVVISANPSTVYALCQMCGCEVSALPEYIQHWSKLRHYCGNQLLDNIDPVAYILEEDPFNEMSFSFSIVLSKKEYLRLCNVAGVEAVKFWLEEKPVCLGEKDVCYGDWKYVWQKGNLLKKKCTKCKYYKENIGKS